MHEDIVYAMMMELHRFRNAFHPRRSEGMLKPFEMAVMHRVSAYTDAGEKAFPSHICKALGFSRSFVAQILTHLEEMEYITRSTQKDDRRMSEIMLTEKGRTLMNNMDNGFRCAMSKLVKGLGEEDSKELLRLIRRSADIMNDKKGE